MLAELSIEVERPLKDVYAAFNNPDNLPRWLSGLQRTEPISGRPGEVGSKTRQIYLERGRIVELVETITAHEPMKRLSNELEGPGMLCAIHVEFVDRGDRTLVLARTELRSRSLMMSLMLPFLRSSVRKRQTADLERFKERLEAGDLSTAPPDAGS